MSAEKLREAAAVLRERAQAAEQGPWNFEGARNGQAPLVYSERGLSVAETFDKPLLQDARYIATMNPIVALALADWLDAEYVTQAEMEPLADVINASFKAVSGLEAGVIEFGRDPGGNVHFRTNTFGGALAVAEAILGGDRA